MSEENEPIFTQIRSPRAAAINGILFSLLSVAIMVLVQRLVTVSPADVNPEWLETNSKAVSIALVMVPFAGISFLWFTGVLRDWMVDREDRFFSTVFFGTGILFVGMLFVWAASFGALFETYASDSDKLVDRDMVAFGYTFMSEILGDYALRMLGVYMSSIATLWLKTKMMPSWLIGITYIVALIFLILANMILEARFFFPGWVFLVSVYILIYNYRRSSRNESGLREGDRKA